MVRSRPNLVVPRPVSASPKQTCTKLGCRLQPARPWCSVQRRRGSEAAIRLAGIEGKDNDWKVDILLPGGLARDEHPHRRRAHDRRRDPAENDERSAGGERAHHRFPGHKQDDHHHQRNGDETINHRTPKKGLHRTDRRVLDAKAEQHADGDDRVESARITDFPLEARFPAHRFRQGVGGGAREHRHAYQADAQNAQREQLEGEVASERSERARRLGRRRDVGRSRDVERDAGREDYEVGRDVGVKHAAPRVPADAAKFHGRRERIAKERRGAFDRLHVLDFLGGLPKEEIGADGGAEDTHDDGGGVGVEGEFGPDRAQRNFAPRDMNREQHRGVGQQGEGQPFQEKDIAVIGNENLQKQRSEHEKRRHEMAIEPADELAHLPHGGDVGGDVQRIGDQQQQHDGLKDHRREGRLDVGGETFPRDPADARAHRLDRGHQRKGQRHGPQHIQAELCAGLGVSGDPARVVVGDARDKPRPDPRERVLFQAAPKEAEGVNTLWRCRRPHFSGLAFIFGGAAQSILFSKVPVLDSIWRRDDDDENSMPGTTSQKPALLLGKADQ